MSETRETDQAYVLRAENIHKRLGDREILKGVRSEERRVGKECRL